jgi:hypothetical protein
MLKHLLIALAALALGLAAWNARLSGRVRDLEKRLAWHAARPASAAKERPCVAASPAPVPAPAPIETPPRSEPVAPIRDEMARLESYDLRQPWTFLRADPRRFGAVRHGSHRLTLDELAQRLGLGPDQKQALGPLWEDRLAKLHDCEAELESRRRAVEDFYDPAVRQFLTTEQQQVFDDWRQGRGAAVIKFTVSRFGTNIGFPTAPEDDGWATSRVIDVVSGNALETPLNQYVEVVRDGQWRPAETVVAERGTDGTLWTKVREADGAESWMTPGEIRQRRY